MVALMKIKKFVVRPLSDIEGIKFGTSRDDVRKKIGEKYKEIQKNTFSKNTMDVYPDFHIYYSEENVLEAIEFFGERKVIIDEHIIFPGNVEEARDLLPSLKWDGYAWTDKKKSISITPSEQDPDIIGAVLVGCKGYFS